MIPPITKALILALILSVMGCASIEHTTKAAQTTGQSRFAGIGDIVLSIERMRNLENALGKSDIFGRKTKEGYTEIRFAGVESDGAVVLYRKDVSIISNETTMSRTPISHTRGYAETNLAASGNAYGNQATLNARSNTNYNSTTISQAEDYHIAVPADTIPIRLQPGETVLPVSGYLIQIESVSENSLKYKVQKQQ